MSTLWAIKSPPLICLLPTGHICDSSSYFRFGVKLYCEVRVNPSSTVEPNIGSLELAEALNRVLPFTATDDARPILQCVNLVAKEGKLTLVSADGSLAKRLINFQAGGRLANYERSIYCVLEAYYV